MTGTTTSLAHETVVQGEAARFIAFVKKPVLPERAAGFSLASLGAVLRLYLLDVALMAVLMAIAAAAMASGFELPDNEISALKLDGAILFQIVVFAPLLEEIAFRSWLSGRPGHWLAALAIVAGITALLLLSAQAVKGPVPALATLAVSLLVAGIGLFAWRRRGPVRWFSRFFPWFFALATIGFALVHLLNYTEGALPVLLPLVLPQLVAGAIFGFARVAYGFWANVLLHMLHNGSAIGLILLATRAGVGAG